ncbi:MAG: hypothetical protein WDW36_004187 [Sanguina aurantia]
MAEDARDHQIPASTNNPSSETPHNRAATAAGHNPSANRQTQPPEDKPPDPQPNPPAAPSSAAGGTTITPDALRVPSEAAAAPAHHISAGLAARLTHRSPAHATQTRSGAFTAEEVASRQLSEEEVRFLSTMDVSSGQLVPTPLQLFLKYNCSGSGKMTLPEFTALVQDTDGLHETPLPEVQAYSLVQFRTADQDKDGMIGMDGFNAHLLLSADFFTHYFLQLCWKFPNHKAGINPGADLFGLFVKASSAGSSGRLEEMSQHQFQHVCKHSKLLDGKRLKQVEVDIIYSRAKGAEQLLKDYLPLRASDRCTAKLYYPQFLFALQHVATIKRITFLQVVPEEVLLRPIGLPPSQAAHERAYLARLTYEVKIEAMLRDGRRLQAKPGQGRASTPAPGEAAAPGKAAAPGPPFPPSAAMQDHSQLGASKNSTETAGCEFRAKGVAGLSDPDTMYQANHLSTDELVIVLKRVFETHNKSKGGLDKSDMDRACFVRCIRECRLSAAGGGTTSAQLDAIFARLASAGQRTVNFPQFLEALRQVARVTRLSLNEVMVPIVVVGGPLPRA